jgi:LmbE family N-acetylglucosaminyl deacetylase
MLRILFKRAHWPVFFFKRRKEIMTQTIERAPSVLGTPVGANALIALAHPDDEFLIGGLLGTFHTYGIATHAVIATDGEASDRGDPERLRNRERRHEAGKALAKYGVRPENQHFLGLPDSGLSSDEHIVKMTHAIEGLLATQSISTVVTLGEHGYDNHTDHKAVHLAAQRAAAEYASIDPDVQLYGLTRNEGDVQIPADPVTKLKRLAYHRSQFEIDTSDPSYKPARDTIEQPGIRLSKQSRAYLDRYRLNMEIERYENYPLG